MDIVLYVTLITESVPAETGAFDACVVFPPLCDMALTHECSVSDDPIRGLACWFRDRADGTQQAMNEEVSGDAGGGRTRVAGAEIGPRQGRGVQAQA